MRRIRAAALGLIAAAALAAGATPAPAEDKGALNVYNWNDYIDPKTIEMFERETGIRVRYDVYDANETLDAKLRAGHSGYDLVVPTASPFLARQIPAGLYRALDRSKLGNYDNLDPGLMEQLARYDPGNRHAIPWMWGTTGLGYNAEKVAEIMPNAPVNSLRMLLDPSVVEKFKDCGVEILDSPTDVFPAVLAYLGRDPDSHSDEDLEAATNALIAIRPFIRKWHSSSYINNLANGDVCLAFGFSGDVIQAARRAADADKPFTVKYAIPAEGAQIWIDAWAIPADAPHADAAYRFLDFVLRPDIAALNSNFVGYANAVPASKQALDPAVRDDPAIYPPEEIRERLFTVSPPDRAYERKRTRAWTRVTTGQ